MFDRNFHLFSEPLGFLDSLMDQDRLLYEQFDQKVLFLQGLPFKLHRPGQMGEGVDSTSTKDVVTPGPNETLLVDNSGRFGTSLSFAVPTAFLDEVKLYFKKAHVKHSITGLLCSSVNAHDQAISCIVQVSAQWVEVAMFKGSTLIFANHYRWYDIADILYYLASVVEQVGPGNVYYVFYGSHCDSDVTAQIVNALALSDNAYEHLQAPKTRLMDLEALASCG